jgi:hypothetical protein
MWTVIASHNPPDVIPEKEHNEYGLKNFDVANTIAPPQAVAVIPISNQPMDFNFYYHSSCHCEHVKMLLSLQHAVALNKSGIIKFYCHPSRHCDNVNMLILPRRDFDTTGNFISSFFRIFFYFYYFLVFIL